VIGLTVTAVLTACSSSAGSAAGASPGPSARASAGSSSAAGPSFRSTSPTPAGTTATSGTRSAGAGNSPSAGAGKSIGGLIAFRGAFQLRGASTQHSSFSAYPGVTSPASSCPGIATHGTPAPAGQRPQFRIPAPPGGSTVYFIAEISPYHGPGTYSRAAIVTSGASFIVGTAGYNLLATKGSVSVTVKANGSGTFTFANAAGDAATQTLSGTVRWTCSG
jgi:hypothetical protein